MNKMIQSATAHDIDYITTDAGNADRLIREHGQDFKYCGALGGWLHWNGVRWVIDDAAIWERAEAVGRALLVEAAKAEDKNTRDLLWKHGKYSLSKPAIDRMIKLAEKSDRVRVAPEMLDANAYALNCMNGTVDVRTGELHQHNRYNLITKLAPVRYDPGATAERWQSFIARVLPEEIVRKHVQKAIGQALTGTVEQQAFYINHGFGMNGKSTFFDILITLLGDYAGTIDIDVLMERNKSGSLSPELASLKGKRLVVSSENNAGQRLKEGLIKRITGDKTITARQLYKKPMTFPVSFKLFLHVNHRPEITGTDYAMWRRVQLIPWSVRINKEERDPHLFEALERELSGVLNWALQGYQRYLDEGLEPPKTVLHATEAYRDDMDKVTQFIADECVIDEKHLFGDSLFVSKDRLYEAYRKWCEETGVHPEKKQKLGQRMAEKEYDPNQKEYIGGKQIRVWRGIGLED
jgi:putative DNA primase/helicase